MALIINENDYPELYLSSQNIFEFNNSDVEWQQSLLKEWKESKPFRSHFPRKTLPAHLFPREDQDEDEFDEVPCLYGWPTTFEDLYDCAMENFPNEIPPDYKKSPYPPCISVYAARSLAKFCGLPTLKLQMGWAGPRDSDRRPILTISNNFETDEQRKSISAEGIKQLRSLVPGLSDEPVWVVDTRNYVWPDWVD